MSKEKLVVSFSGGKTSAYMCDYLMRNHSDKYDFVFCFANTGREHEKTLEFVKKCDEHFNLNLVWLEAVINPEKGKGVRHKIVTFETASRNGEPFAAYIAKEGVPNVSKAVCTERLKTFPIKSYMRDNGLLRSRSNPGAKIAIGMRADEPKRNDPNKDAVKRHNLVYPLSHWIEVDKQDVNDYWESMPFTLELPERYGNCLTCFKKSDNKLKLIAREHPEWYEWNDSMEKEHGNGYVFFRKGRSTQQLISEAQLADIETLKHLAAKDDPDVSGGCSQSCEAFK